MDNIKRPWFYLLAPTLLARMILGYGSIALCSCSIFLLSLTQKKDTPYTGWRFKLISIWTSVSARLTLLASGIFYINEENVDFDYKKYLGPDWKADKNAKPGSVICNH